MYNKIPAASPFLSQVAINDDSLIKRLIHRSTLGAEDLVVEIGAGRGKITRYLANTVRQVWAVEKDPHLCDFLRKTLPRPTVQIIEGDALKMNLPGQEYKIFANPPFYIEGKLIRKILRCKPLPSDAYLVMRKNVAERMAGVSYRSRFYILHRPQAEITIFHYFNREDFSPKPMVRSAMLRITRRTDPVVNLDCNKTARLWEGLVKQGFGGGGDIRQNLGKIFTNTQLRQMSAAAAFKLDARPRDLVYCQWREIFAVLKNIAAPRQQEMARQIATPKPL